MYTYIYIYLNPRTQPAFCLEYHSIIIRSHQSPINHSQSRINLLHRRLVQSQICILIVSRSKRNNRLHIRNYYSFFSFLFFFVLTYSVATVCKFFSFLTVISSSHVQWLFFWYDGREIEELSRTVFHNTVSSSSQIYQHPTVRCIAVICGREKVECFFVFFFFFWQHCSDQFDCVICYLQLIMSFANR